MVGPPHWKSSLSEYLQGELCKESSLVLGLGGAEAQTDGRPGDEADADLVVELRHVELHLLPVEGMVLGVLAERGNTVQTAGHAEGLEYLHRAPLGRPPVHHLQWKMNIFSSHWENLLFPCLSDSWGPVKSLKMSQNYSFKTSGHFPSIFSS